MHKNKRKIIKDYITFSFNGQTNHILLDILKTIKKYQIEVIYFDGSVFGNLYRRIKHADKNIRIITYFHNVEIVYYLQRIRFEGLSRLLLLPSIYYNEFGSVKYSDDLILLNQRDVNQLQNIYSIQIKNKAIFEIPIFLLDRFDPNRSLEKCDYKFLFIGSGFYANLHGVKWFIEKVLPFISGKLLVIGKGMDVLKKKYSDSEKLEIKGEVDNLTKYYYEDNIVVSPIFLGSGMKTKTIEALMYNKYIVGTKEAFVGLANDEIDEVGTVCNNSKEFISVLNNLSFTKRSSRKLFEKRFSFSIAKEKYKTLLGL